MPTNGKRRPPRPRIELLSPAPSPEEAAAVVAAIERFIADTAPPPPAGGSPRSRWQQAALEEGVGAKEAVVSPWGAPRGWGAR